MADLPKLELSSSSTVVVACKMPHGLIIRDHVKTTVKDPILGGGFRPSDVWRPVGPRIRIKGPQVPALFIRMVEVVGGYAITERVPADVFRRWIDWNKDSSAVVNNLIYGHENGDRVRDWAREHERVKSGLEPLDARMITKEGRQIYADERVVRAGADLVQAGNVKEEAA